MNRKLRLLSLILVLILAFGMTSCAKEEPASTSMEVNKEVVEEPAEEPATEEPAAETEANVVEEKVMAYFANMPDHIYKIGQKDFLDMVKAGEDITILDIRSEKDYSESHVKGAFNLPWGTAISDNLSKIPNDKPVFVYCYTGQTAGQAVATLNVAGFNARSVNLGWNLGISTVEGYDEVAETTVNALSDDVTEINSDVQIALDDYYSGLNAVADTKYKNYKISEDGLKEMVDSEDDSIYVLSVRSEKDYLEGHIKGASNIPWGKGMEQQFSTLPMDKTIVVYCYTGQTAGQTVAGLRLLGYDAVSLNGGMGMEPNAPYGWSNKGFEVVK
uniref:Rhodanese n=1 Tax=thiosulfate-reducing anaerobe SRL 4198 TaxID=267367 RepID=Q6Q1D9_UNCXX|nr:rhodanese [thiosulfate-reducing anaerobe SRL 4198]